MYRGQTAAIPESMTTDACYTFWNGDRGQAAAIIEGITADAGYLISYDILFNLSAKDITQRRGGNIGFGYNAATLNRDTLQATTAREGITTDACYTLGDGDGGQTAAIIESMVTNGCHVVWDGDRGQAAAIIESTVTNGCHVVWDGDRGQAAAIIEGIAANACYTTGNDKVFYLFFIQIQMLCVGKRIRG